VAKPPSRHNVRFQNFQDPALIFCIFVSSTDVRMCTKGKGLIYPASRGGVTPVRNIGLSHSAAEKLARFLLDLSANHDQVKSEVRLTLTLTHEEIAQRIGASRETVTRLFVDFKKKQLLQVKGSSLIITNKAGLESVLGS
jgi:Crp-like helix-turn-helix domain